MQERGSIYGKASDNLKCTRLLRRIYDSYRIAAGHNPHENEAHDEAIGMVLHKIARIATGQFHPDNYDDTCGYATIAKEIKQGVR